MRISVLGLGHAGAVTAGCLARDGHPVTGVDTDPAKVALINAGRTPILEKHIGEIIAEQVAAGRLRATDDVPQAVRSTDLVFVCVATPSLPNGNVDLRYVRRVCEQIGRTLKTHHGAPVVVVRSTMPPGSMRELVIPTLEKFSGKRAGEEFGVCIHPEFLREGTSVHDFCHPPKTVIGEMNRASGDLVASLYARTPGALLRVDLDTAEMLKYADSAWHALTAGFANEIGTLCKALDVDAHRVMDLFSQDLKPNLPPHALKPGFALGGSCLPGDLRALLHKAKRLEVAAPILEAILPSHRLQLERGVQAVIDKGHRRVGILGLSLEAGSDDLRQSPMVELAERLIGKGYDVRVYERSVSLARLHAASREHILARIPHISRLMVESVEDVLAHARTIVIGNAAPEFAEVPRRLADGQTVIDFMRVCQSRTIRGVYEGICW